MSSTQIERLHCPFRGFHFCPYSEEGSKGVSRLVHHFKSLHLSIDERISTIHKALESNWSLFMALEETLRMVKQWMFGMCMSFHAISRSCHIVHIVKPSRKDFVAIGSKEGMVLDARLLDEVLQVPIFTMKSILQSCRIAFSQALKDALYHDINYPCFGRPWVRLLLFPCCTLNVFKPQTRKDHRSPCNNVISLFAWLSGEKLMVLMNWLMVC